MRLLEMQEAMLRALTSPPVLMGGAPLPSSVLGVIDGHWSVYATGYLARVEEALENDYPAVRRILGASSFRSLAARYLAACPSRSPDLGRVGARLPVFLGDDPLSTDLPFLPDLARLEWALAEAFVATDPAPLSWPDVLALGPEGAVDVPLFPAAGTAVIRSAWPLLDLRECAETPDEEVSIPVQGRPSVLLVWRRGLDVRCVAVEDADGAFVEACGPGSTLAQLAAQGSDVAGLAARLRRLVEMGVIARPQGGAWPTKPEERRQA